MFAQLPVAHVSLLFYIMQYSNIAQKFIKWYWDENGIFPILTILKHKQVCMRRKNSFYYLREIFQVLKYAN